jgi:PASTA domain
MKRLNVLVVLVAALALLALAGLHRSLRDPLQEGLTIPDVVGLPLSEANAELRADQLQLGSLQAVRSKSATGTVLKQSVAPGTPTSPFVVVALVVSAGSHPTPDAHGLVGVGGTCEVVSSPPAQGGPPCAGGPLIVPLVPNALVSN